MPRRKFIDKKNATTFALVHRAQNDPLIHDDTAPSMVFTEVNNYNASRKRIPTRSDLDSEFGDGVRDNEGEAANYGIYYDDTAYDYMQHMRDLGQGGGVWVDGESEAGARRKGKGKKNLEDALRSIALDDGGRSVASSMASTSSAADVFGPEMAESEFVRNVSYQDQQDVPDAIAGLQPDMDPRLREVLEALEDEAYVENDEEDFFKELAEGGEAADEGEWEAHGDDFWADEGEHGGPVGGDEEDGWETDDTVKPSSPKSEEDQKSLSPQPAADADASVHLPAPEEAGADRDEPTDSAWIAEFKKFKQDKKAEKRQKAAFPAPSDLTGISSMAGRKKKRKGALTNPSAYSMTSASLARTDQMSTLDERFEKKLEKEYGEDGYAGDDNLSLASGMTGMSKMSGMSKASRASRFSALSGISESSEAPPLRSDFDSIMDDFLGSHSKQGRRRIKRDKPQTGMEQLEEIRQGLGPARLRTTKA